MENPFLQSPKSRLQFWKDLRNGLVDLSKSELLKVVEFWALAPLCSRTIDYYSFETWPTAWELLHQGNFCKSTIGLGIFYTLYHAFPGNKIGLKLIKDLDIEDIYLVSSVDKMILNFEYNAIVDFDEISQKVLVLQEFSYGGEKWQCLVN